MCVQLQWPGHLPKGQWSSSEAAGTHLCLSEGHRSAQYAQQAMMALEAQDFEEMKRPHCAHTPADIPSVENHSNNKTMHHCHSALAAYCHCVAHELIGVTISFRTISITGKADTATPAKLHDCQ